MKTEKKLKQEHLTKSISYSAYTTLIEDLLAQNKTTGNNHSENMIHYTQLNKTRMDRWTKKYSPSDETSQEMTKLSEKQHWIIITEGWCGDASHSVPIISKIASENPNVELHVLLRDENLDLMDSYLTNGGRSIPKLIAFDENHEELWQWGPRPSDAQEMFTSKKEEGIDKLEINMSLQKWYNKDKGQTIEREILAQINKQKKP